MTRLQKFDNFYNENKDKLYMPLKKNYPLNYKKGIDWANAQCDVESSLFARSIIDNTMYISFIEFITEIKKISFSYLENIKKDKDFKYILIIPFKIKKSNTWVGLLVYKYLKNIIDDIDYTITNVYNNTLDSKHALFKKKVRCILCDDCSYTGQQLAEVLSFNNKMNTSNRKEEPIETSKEWLDWYNSIKKNIDIAVNNININIFSADIIIPFISTKAHSLLTSLHYVRLPKDRILFDTFINQTDTRIYNKSILREFQGTFQFHDDISAIYFDHKIADAVSTFNKVYLTAPLFNCLGVNTSVFFIDNCDNSKILNIIDPYAVVMDIEKIVEVCPPTFYKRINYTYNNNVIDTDLELSAILG